MPELETLAVERWMISPPVKRYISPALFLPGQLDRIRTAAFGSVDEIVRGFRGGYISHHSATWGYRLKDVDLLDGTLYTSKGAVILRSRRSRLPIYRRPKVAMKEAGIFETWMGNRWFGNWLLDDCVAYWLAHASERPVRTRASLTKHQREYSERLGFSATVIGDTHFDQVIIFNDEGHNDSKRERADMIRTQLVGSSVEAHPGVFLLRGSSGDQRLLHNEQEISEKLAHYRGFRIVDPAQASLDQILEACAGARVVAGVEGSHLAHGMTVMANDASLVVIQPPDRVVSAMKISTDRQGQAYAFVIADPAGNGFRVEWEDIARTLDLVMS